MVQCQCGTSFEDMTELANRLTIVVGRPETVAEISDRILAGFGDDWGPLALTSGIDVAYVTTEGFITLLLNQEAKRN